jgi:hypothetical protein
MGRGKLGSVNLRTVLELGRVSNLPTVWSNVLAGMVLAGGAPEAVSLLVIGIAASSLYTGGMVLNDAFDAEIDAHERPERPIPSGRVSRRAATNLGAAFLGLGVALVAVHAVVTGIGVLAIFAAAVTAGLIVLYDRWHKGNPYGPLLMGLCRVGVYAIAGLSVRATLTPPLAVGAVLLLGYVLGLTYVAKREGQAGPGRLWPLLGLWAPVLFMLPLLRAPLLARAILAGFGYWTNRALELRRRGAIPAAVGSMIAGIALLDALLIARWGPVSWSLGAVAAFGATVALQRRIAGT